MKNIKLLALAAFLIFFNACQKEEIEAPRTDDPLMEFTDIESFYNSKTNLKRAFGKSLLSAMQESEALRTLLKEEALKMFNKDYEVLYYHIKDMPLENGLSVEELIVKQLGSQEQLDQILEAYPTLTILVPQLPQGSFSAITWNPSFEIPAVAIRTNEHNEIPMINNEGEEKIIPSNVIPSFPILVIKNNERLITNRQGIKNFDKLDTRVVYEGDGLVLKFWANNFDNSIGEGVEKRLTLNLDPKLEQAYDIYESADGWQRDFIYYDIEPSNTNGEFSYDYKEHMTQFRLLGDPEAAYSKISDQTGDPTINPLINGNNPNNYWSGGFFEFKVRTLINASNGVGSELINGFTCAPEDLFTLTYRKLFWDFYVLDNIALRTKSVSLPIINWQLESYAASIKIEVEEVDLTETTVTTDSRVVKFATNFEIGPSGFLEKIGLKFGSSLEITETNTVQKTVTQGNDFLGEAIINFADKVVTGSGSILGIEYHITREYSTGLCAFSVEPKRVQ